MMRRQLAYVNVQLKTTSGDELVFETRVEATCTDNATHLICHNVMMDYPAARDVKVTFARWGELGEVL